ncbi:MAG: hypothetical protein ACXADF_18435 [Candidatus Thorarchaeota archaeon]
MSTQQIIKNWQEFLITEGLDEACNRYFDPDTGHFTSKEDAARKGGTYSISTAASKRCGDVESKPGKMKVTKAGKLKPKFTLAQCGRTDAQSGGKKPKDKRCRDYGKGGRYGDENTKTKREGLDPVSALPTTSRTPPRAETPAEKKERLFNGHREISKLARGIYEVSGVRIVRPDEVDVDELMELALLLGENQGQCPSHCVQQVLDLFARIKQAEKGEQ